MTRSRRFKVAPRRGYVLNKRTGIFHKVPPLEQCNTDDIPRKLRAYSSGRRIPFEWNEYWPCQHCFR